MLIETGRLLLRAAGWGITAAAVTSAVSAAARAACLPPYWPPSYILRCRLDPILTVFARATLDALITTLLLFVPAAAVGLLVQLILRVSSRKFSLMTSRVAAATAGLVCWFVVMKRLEVSYLDAIVSWYAVAAGALAAGVAATRSRRQSAGPVDGVHGPRT